MKDKIEFGGLDERYYGVPLFGGLLAGLVSFIVGYLSFLGIAAGTGDGIDFEARSLRQVGHFFYNSFLVPTHQQTKQVVRNTANNESVLQESLFSVRYNPFYQADSIDVDTQTYLDGALYDEQSRTLPVENARDWALPDLTFPDFVYLAIPVVVLFGVGFVLAYRYVSMDDTQLWWQVAIRGLVGGGTITLGFVLLALVGMYLFVVDGVAIFTQQAGEGAFTRPDRVDTLVFGIAYPAVLSTAGVLAGQLSRRPTIQTTKDIDDTADRETDAEASDEDSETTDADKHEDDTADEHEDDTETTDNESDS
ncbi:hypothetical protein SAMN05216226_101336 [Halovenus aranensis]|uniref:DUF7978 domain-containing protein n=1 Tax=Halovenus aranensis TaxID=890420 RepID=A0A1G8S809_9EURY|nr:hypothetical protein [Halovenus aranensis]SDJ25337.1 hypothetical protein SAMN05216226_101336 [Halovenus aranensis]